MKFKKVQIIKESFWGIKYIASYYNDHSDPDNMREKLSSYMPRKGDVISVINKKTHKQDFLNVRHVCIDYVKDEMTIWC